MSDPILARSTSPFAFDKKTSLQLPVINSLFTGQLIAESAASRLAGITVPNPNIDPEDCEEDLQLLWGNVLTSLVEVPDQVSTVADLIWCISKLPPPITESGQQLAVNEGIERVWNDTPTLGWALRDEWNGEFSQSIYSSTIHALIRSPVDLSEKNGLATRQAAIDRFITMNTLIAQLMVRDAERFDYKIFMLWTLRSALEYTAETPEAGSQSPDFRACHILAAAELVKVSGHLICHWDFEVESGPLIGDRGAGGVLWDGKHGFCKERWELWRRRFLEVSQEEELSNEVGACAKTANEAMS